MKEVDHYCGRRHDPSKACPPTEIEFGGVPASRLPGCHCRGLDHDASCERGRAIRGLVRKGKQ